MTVNNHNIQFNRQGQLQHFLSIEGINRTLLNKIIENAKSFTSVGDKIAKTAPLMRGKTVMNMFFEPSTRTLTTFELAAKRLSADVMNLNVLSSATKKGESLSDTLRTLEAMHCDMFIVRHPNSGAAHFIATQLGDNTSVINGGDGQHAHPTQAALDMFTIAQHKPDFTVLKVAIVGDIMHSRVARSDIHALNLLGAEEIRVIGPRTLIPDSINTLGVHAYYNMAEGLAEVDVIIMLRLQHERMRSALLPSAKEYYRCYGLTDEKLAYAKPDVIVMHPGPVNRGVEIASSVADGKRSVILRQVSHGIAVRMAIMAMISGNKTSSAY